MLHDVLKRDADAVGGDCHIPEHIAELVNELVCIERVTLVFEDEVKF